MNEYVSKTLEEGVDRCAICDLSHLSRLTDLTLTDWQ